MIQLVFDATDAKEAFDERPVEVITASTRAASGPTGTTTRSSVGERPVVFPVAGTHANFFDESLDRQLPEQGFGCDDTRGPHVDLNPTVVTIPSDPDLAQKDFPWIGFERPLGRAPAGVLQRPDRTEPQDAVDRADPLVGGVAVAELRGADRRALGGPARPTSSAVRWRRAARARRAAAQPGRRGARAVGRCSSS